MRKNTKTVRPTPRTHGGAPAARISTEQALRRSVLATMLWENQFYEDGQTIADRIAELSSQVHPEVVAQLAIEAREQQKLRHVPLLLVAGLARQGGSIVSQTLSRVIKRADELAEFLAIYWRNGRTPLSKQVKLGLAQAFTKFDAYALAKYNRDTDIKLRDVLFLTHAKPKDEAQAQLWKQLVDGTLPPADTWENALSNGGDKRDEFQRLLEQGKLGYLALLRNLRNMEQSGVSRDLVRQAILARKGADNVLPFRYVAAARAAPTFEPELDQALLASLADLPQFEGTTMILVDISGSMNMPLSARSDLRRMEAAATLASVFPGSTLVYSFSDRVVQVPARKGMAGVDAIIRSQAHSCTDLAGAVKMANRRPNIDRLVVITDEQATTGRVPNPKVKKAYMINVASARNGVGYGAWTHIDGFSESVLRWMAEFEKQQ